MSANFPHHVSHGDAVRGVTAESHVPSTGVVRRIMNFLEGVFALAILLLTFLVVRNFSRGIFSSLGEVLPSYPNYVAASLCWRCGSSPGFIF